MEVASPLPFNHSQTRTKRRYVPSPIIEAPSVSSDDYAMDESSGYGHSFKRRRFGSSDNVVEMNQSTVASASSLVPMAFGTSQTNRSPASLWKRQRTDEIHASSSPEKQMQQTIERQTAQIERLTTEKFNVVKSYNELKTTHDKAINENKILKRAVTIQQERQNQAASELDAAHKYKGEAEDKMKKYEQIIMTLRYHLQAQQPCKGHDFLGMDPRPPDVF